MSVVWKPVLAVLGVSKPTRLLGEKGLMRVEAPC